MASAAETRKRSAPCKREAKVAIIPSRLRSGSEEAAAMGMSIAQAVAALMGTCARRLSRAARRLHLRPREGIAASFSSRAIVPFLGGGGGGGKKAISSSSSKSKRRKARGELSFRAEDGVWRKEILMGERCQPLDFSGVIYYDAEGRRLAQPPPPRSPLRSPLPASVKLAANAGGGY
ncbi:hypothetical protein E2562_028933 [Oryza meyeriana var. granulata]|uniref:Uncharacterized protein n=1 Tax=Oryza meyeriana var. granulata TaxID=110450 RepID=A0A6G1FDT0_9ORYZ|nr:hypothetical protein E2562_028933 [Oryza meyeriana var. granulata]